MSPIELGERFVKSMYSGGAKSETGHDELRYLYAISPKYVPVERMPPTKKAFYYHSLRVHHQVNTRKRLETPLDKEDYGFHVDATSVNRFRSQVKHIFLIMCICFLCT